MKFTTANGEVIEGTFEEIQQYKKAYEGTTKHTKTIDGITAIVEYAATLTDPVMLTTLIHKYKLSSQTSTYDVLEERLIKAGFVVIKTDTGRKGLTRILLPKKHRTDSPSQLTPNVVVKKNPQRAPSSSTDSRKEMIAAVIKKINDDGFIVFNDARIIYKSPYLSSSTLVRDIHLTKPHMNIFVLKQRGLYLESDENREALRRICMEKKSRMMRTQPPSMLQNKYRAFITERMTYYTRKLNMRSSDAMTKAANDWTTFKASGLTQVQFVGERHSTPQRTGTASSPRPKDDEYAAPEDTSRKIFAQGSAVYYDVIKKLHEYGFERYSKDFLDGIGQSLLHDGKVSWSFTDMYIQKGDWETQVLPLIAPFLPKLSIAWGFKHSPIIEDGVLVYRR